VCELTFNAKQKQKTSKCATITNDTEYNTVIIKDAKLNWIVKCFTSPPTQYRLYGRRFLQVKRPNQQYQSTEGESTKERSGNAKNKIHICIHNWIVEQCFTSPPTQYRLYGRRFLQVKRPNQQYQSTKGESTKERSGNAKNKIHICMHNWIVEQCFTSPPTQCRLYGRGFLHNNRQKRTQRQ